MTILAVLGAIESSPKLEERNGFIVNGEDADIADFPHHLGLFDQGRFFCGASVLSAQWALSAAHCLDLGTDPSLVKEIQKARFQRLTFQIISQINLWGGSTSRLTGGHLFFVQSYHLHPLYRRITLSTGQVIWDHDVAVLRVHDDSLLQGFPHITPVVLSPECSAECCGVCVGDEIRLAGWVRLEIMKSIRMV